ncbi:MAG: hydroxymethylglutaryl-CoA lyase [Phycisphaerales bacterium]|nr:hydroxymethylglutaryl-CoA lyase [Phycisphaerales bacterium]
MSNKPCIDITEMGPRDGLQNISTVIPSEDKVALINLLSKCGLKRIEATAFVHPKWVPQLSDAEQVLGSITRVEGVQYTALVPNVQGWERSLSTSIDEIGVLTAASDTFCEKNLNTTIEGSLAKLRPLVQLAHEQKQGVRCYISCAVRCPFSGPAEPVRLRELTQTLIDFGIDDIDFGDTIGVAEPDDILRLLDTVDGLLEPADLTLHLHNTNGRAIDCAKVAIESGVRRFDASVGGLGGCPYAPGAEGNVSTESLHQLANDLGFETGICFEKLLEAKKFILQKMPCS